jgi:hypothetical protein
VHGYAVVGRVPESADIVRYCGRIDDDVARVVVGDKEDGRAVFIDVVVCDARAENGQGHRVAVIVDGAAAAAARRTGLGRIGAVPDGAVVGKQAVDDGPRDTNAADGAAVGSTVAVSVGPAEGAVDDIDGQALVLAEHPDGAAAHIRAFIGADIIEKTAVDGLEPSPAHPDGPAAVIVGFSGGIAIGKGDVLHRQPRMVLVLAMRGGPDLVLIAGVHVQNAGLSPAAERHPAAAIDDDVGVGVVEHFGRTGERYGDRIGTAVEYNGSPWATASIKASALQLSGVPLPTT